LIKDPSKVNAYLGFILKNFEDTFLSKINSTFLYLDNIAKLHLYQNKAKPHIFLTGLYAKACTVSYTYSVAPVTTT